MLDMDTGGGERLINLSEHATTWPGNVCATEGYKPNVSVARRNLEPIGVTVFEFERYEELPFDDDSFDLIINRHGDYRVGELKCILRPGGVFITQQIGAAEGISFGELLGGPPPKYPPIALADAAFEFEHG